MEVRLRVFTAWTSVAIHICFERNSFLNASFDMPKDERAKKAEIDAGAYSSNALHNNVLE